MSQEIADKYLDQVFFGFHDDRGMEILDGSFTDRDRSQQWTARLESHIRLRSVADVDPPMSALSYLRFPDGTAAVVRRHREPSGTHARNASHVLIGSSGVLQSGAALGLDGWSGWSDRPVPGAAVRPVPYADLEPIVATGQAAARRRAAELGPLLEQVLAQMSDRPTAPITVVGVPEEDRLAVVWAVRRLGARLVGRDVRRRWTFSTWEVSDSEPVEDFPELVFLPLRPIGSPAVPRVLVVAGEPEAVTSASADLAGEAVARLVDGRPLLDVRDGLPEPADTPPLPQPSSPSPVSEATGLPAVRDDRAAATRPHAVPEAPAAVSRPVVITASGVGGHAVSGRASLPPTVEHARADAGTPYPSAGTGSPPHRDLSPIGDHRPDDGSRRMPAYSGPDPGVRRDTRHPLAWLLAARDPVTLRRRVQEIRERHPGPERRAELRRALGPDGLAEASAAIERQASDDAPALHRMLLAAMFGDRLADARHEQGRHDAEELVDVCPASAAVVALAGLAADPPDERLLARIGRRWLLDHGAVPPPTRTPVWDRRGSSGSGVGSQWKALSPVRRRLVVAGAAAVVVMVLGAILWTGGTESDDVTAAVPPPDASRSVLAPAPTRETPGPGELGGAGVQPGRRVYLATAPGADGSSQIVAPCIVEGSRWTCPLPSGTDWTAAYRIVQVADPAAARIEATSTIAASDSATLLLDVRPTG